MFGMKLIAHYGSVLRAGVDRMSKTDLVVASRRPFLVRCGYIFTLHSPFFWLIFKIWIYLRASSFWNENYSSHCFTSVTHLYSCINFKFILNPHVDNSPHTQETVDSKKTKKQSDITLKWYFKSFPSCVGQLFLKWPHALIIAKWRLAWSRFPERPASGTATLLWLFWRWPFIFEGKKMTNPAISGRFLSLLPPFSLSSLRGFPTSSLSLSLSPLLSYRVRMKTHRYKKGKGIERKG